MHQNIRRRLPGAICAALGVAVLAAAAYEPGAKAAAPVRQFALHVDGAVKAIRTSAVTLGEALTESGIIAGPDDKVYPPLTSPVKDGLKARIVRIEVKTVSFDEPISKQTIRKPSATVRNSYGTISDPGEDGIRKATYRVTYADGKKVLKELVSSTITKPSRPRVILFPAGSRLPSRGFYSRKVMVMQATAYDPGPASCGKWADGRTATGMRAGHGVVAVDPKVIKLGTRLYIEGYGFAVAGDVGGAIKGNRIDLGCDTRRTALNFGRRKVVVHIID